MRRMALLLVAAVALSTGLASCAANVTGAARAHSRLTLEVHLAATTAIVGNSIAGTAVLTNNTSKPIRTVGVCPESWVEVGLVSHRVSFDPAVSLDCLGRYEVDPGKSLSTPITVQTMYDGCGGSGVPLCPRGNRFPLLPLGTYAVKVLDVGLPAGTTIVRPPSVALDSASTGRSFGPEGGSLLVQAYSCEIDRPQPPLSVFVTHDGVVVSRRSALGVTQELVVPLRPGVYYIHSNVRAPQEVRVLNGLQSSAVVLQDCRL